MAEEEKTPGRRIEITEHGHQEPAKAPEIETIREVDIEEPKRESGPSKLDRFKGWYAERKKWTIPLSVVLFLLLLFAIPFSRYALAGTVMKKNYEIKVVDSKTQTPVSGAEVQIGPATASADGSGKLTLRNVKVGPHKLTITKKYYKDGQAKVVVPIMKQKGVPTVSLEATGRQVKVTVVNGINHDALAGVDIKVSDVAAKSDKEGNATLVLPAGTESAKAKLSLDGYNDAEATIKVSDQEVKENKFNLTPAGKIYFLSKQSGKIDVVKTNLDGSSRQTVLSGTGKEDDRGTLLLASRDWKYLALYSRRDSGSAKLYLVDTTNNDKLTLMDTANAEFTSVGWSDNNFIYYLSKINANSWEPHNQILKSYNAGSKQLLTLDQTNATGTSESDYAQEVYNSVNQIGKNVIYAKSWNSSYYNQTTVADKQAGIYSINATGSNAQTLKTSGYEVGKSTYFYSTPYKASQLIFQGTEKNNTTYYLYNGGKVTEKADMQDEFNEYNQTPVTYLVSPSSNQTFWAENRDGKNTLFIGDNSGDNGKQIASLSEYTTYGWYTDDYLLASKSSSELYIMSKKGPSNDVPPVKISDYHKPARSIFGYGGGYGGL